MALKIDAKCEGKVTCAFKNNMKNSPNFIFLRLKNSDFILESKMVELNKTTRSTRCSVKTLFYLCSTESLLLSYKKISKKAVKLGSFLQFSVHIFIGHDGYFCKINLGIL